jgi:hypothetical protein
MAKSYYSTVFDRSADEVWATIRDFNGLAVWFSSAVSRSEIEGGRSGDSVGAVRNFLFGDARIREHLVALSDVERSYTYEFGDPAPFPVLHYLSTLRVTPITDGGKALVEWWTTFDCETSELDHWTAFFASEVFRPALQSLRAYLAK